MPMKKHGGYSEYMYGKTAVQVAENVRNMAQTTTRSKKKKASMSDSHQKAMPHKRDMNYT